MTDIGRTLVVSGAVLVLLGAAAWIMGRWGFHGLPGDVRYDIGNVRFYFPIVTCLIASAVLTALCWFGSWLFRR